jgi:hypothetical protein
LTFDLACAFVAVAIPMDMHKHSASNKKKRLLGFPHEAALLRLKGEDSLAEFLMKLFPSFHVMDIGNYIQQPMTVSLVVKRFPRAWKGLVFGSSKHALATLRR